MEKVRLNLLSLSESPAKNTTYVVVLGDLDRQRTLPVVIGYSEAQSILLVVEQMTSPRPLTHDLMKRMMDTYDIELKEVIINKVLEGVFFSQLICEKNGQKEILDSRTSDAIALAVRFNCPIYTYDLIMDALGIDKEILLSSDNEDEEDEDEDIVENFISSSSVSNNLGLENVTSSELKNMLENALEHEDYEKAAILRDALDKRLKDNL
ncbi:MAG: bifunctional nuclease family protein [Chitinophagales bacterium]|nr:bifunctional nuclease family protein [Chitinophagales bacterium]